MIAAQRTSAHDDDGFTLVELVVATAILSIILLAIGGMMFSTTITQRSVTAMSQSASSAQTAADAIRIQIRNADQLEVKLHGVADQELRARVTGTGSGASYDTCRAWYYAAEERQLRTTSWAVGSSPASDVSTWMLLLDGISPRPGSTVVFHEPAGNKITVEFEVESDDRNEPTAIQFIAAHPDGQGGGTPC